MKKLLTIIVVVVLILGTILYIGRPKVQNFTLTTSDKLNVAINIKKGNVNYHQGTDKASGSIKFAGNKPSIVNTNNEFIITDPASVINQIDLTGTKDFMANKLSLIAGATNTNLPLRFTKIPNIDIKAGAGNIDIEIPGSISTKINITMGAGNIKLNIPINDPLDGVKITSSAQLNFDKGATGFKKIKNGYETEGFSTAKITSEINIEGGTFNLSIDSIE